MPELVKHGKILPNDASGYFGGHIADEVAALVALGLGVSLRAAGTRMMSLIRYPGEPARSPLVRRVRPLTTPHTYKTQRLPRVRTRPTNLNGLELILAFPRLSRKKQTALVLAARSYASALWIAGEDPNMAWLDLVTAIEIAADEAIRVRVDPVDLVRDLWPEMWSALHPATDHVRHDVAAELAQQMKATQKFITFLTGLAPEPPPKRPEWDKFDWETMSEAAKTI